MYSLLNFYVSSKPIFVFFFVSNRFFRFRQHSIPTRVTTLLRKDTDEVTAGACSTRATEIGPYSCCVASNTRDGNVSNELFGCHTSGCGHHLFSFGCLVSVCQEVGERTLEGCCGCRPLGLMRLGREFRKGKMIWMLCKTLTRSAIQVSHLLGFDFEQAQQRNN